MTWIRSLAKAIGLISLIAAAAAGQALATPEAHWGGNMLPDLRDRADFGVHFLGFTQYGKEVFRFDTTRYTFTPYNDIPQTLGFNILAYSRMQNGLLMKHSDRPTEVDPGPLSRRRTFMLGIVNDHIPEFLQNDVIHRGNLQRDKLRRVPRKPWDTKTHTSYGPNHNLPLVAGWSDEYFLRLYAPQRDDGHETRQPTPLFIGGGWQLSTLQQEAFLHAGSSVYETTRFPDWFPLPHVLQIRSFGVGGMARVGALKAGHYFPDIVPAYANAQGLVRLGTEIASGFPVQLEYALTSAYGFFASPRSPSELATINEFRAGTDSTHLYQAKTPARELFFSIRVRIGDFTFETYNDSPGGKDKGPSFGASMSYNLYRPDRRFPWFGGISKQAERDHAR